MRSATTFLSRGLTLQRPYRPSPSARLCLQSAVPKKPMTAMPTVLEHAAVPQCCVFIAISLDGFIARPDGAIDWLDAVQLPGEDYGYAGFYAKVDTLVMGRNTWDTVCAFPEWAYTGKRIVVLTNRPPPAAAAAAFADSTTASADTTTRGRPDHAPDTASLNSSSIAASGGSSTTGGHMHDVVGPHGELFYTGSPRSLVTWLHDQLGAQRVYVDGGQVIQQFLAAGLLHEITVSVIPVLLGEGVPLFGNKSASAGLGQPQAARAQAAGVGAEAADAAAAVATACGEADRAQETGECIAGPSTQQPRLQGAPGNTQGNQHVVQAAAPENQQLLLEGCQSWPASGLVQMRYRLLPRRKATHGLHEDDRGGRQACNPTGVSDRRE